jgi:3-deoxy-7-phosphoheptulonate synthase
VLVDCSHDNSGRDYRNQPGVFRCLLEQYATGRKAILGMMLESNLVSGSQKLGSPLARGKSITDQCIDWATTDQLLGEAYERLGG